MSHYSEKHEFIFIHIPKNAGTSLVAAIKEQIPDLRAFEKDFESKPGYVRDPYFANHYRLDQILDHDPKYEDHTMMMVIRNPWERMVSLYNHRLRKKDLLYRGKPRVSNTENTLLEAGFRTWLKHTHDEIAHSNQFDWCENPDILVRFEDMKPGLDKFTELTGLKLNVPVLNVGTGNSKDYRKYYNEHTFHIVLDRFEKDIVEYGYRF